MSILRVELVFHVITKADVQGVSKELEDLPWAETLARGLGDERMDLLGIQAIVPNTRTISTITAGVSLPNKPARRRIVEMK